MLYNFLVSLVDQFSALNVFRYLTFRTGLSVMSSMIIVFLIGGPIIRFIELFSFDADINYSGTQWEYSTEVNAFVPPLSSIKGVLVKNIKSELTFNSFSKKFKGLVVYCNELFA